MQQEEGADSFTLLHHDLNICTNPAQYERIMDIVNNLLLYVEPHKKEAHDKLQNMRFKFALSNMEDMRTPILDRQNNVRWGVKVLSLLCSQGGHPSYRKTSNISRTLVGNIIVDNSDVVGASPVGAAPTTSAFST